MRLTIRTDGGSRGNPGLAGAGVVIENDRGETVFSGGFYLGQATNNAAEYAGLLRSLEVAARLGGTDLRILLDSELIVRQINGRYRVKNARLKSYYDRVKALLGRFEKTTVEHVLRQHNSLADALANRAMDAGCDFVETDFSDPTSSPCQSSVESADTDNQSSQWPTNIRSMIQFSKNGPVPRLIGVGRDFHSELICIDTGQRFTICVAGPSRLLILRGEGLVELAGRKASLETGSWLELSGGDSAELIAGSQSQIVAILIGLS